MSQVERFKTPIFRLSFPNLFKADSYQGGTPKYGCTAVWTPSDFTDSDKDLWKKLKAGLNAAAKDKFKMDLKDLPANIRKGIRDGAEKADLEGFGKGTIFASLSTRMRPGVVDRSLNKIGPDEGNEDEIYPGCYCRATVSIYAYDNVGKGIALGLMNIQKVRDGERLDSRTDAAEDFDDDFLGDEPVDGDEGGEDGDEDFI